MKTIKRLRSVSKFHPAMMLVYGLLIGAAGLFIVTSRAATPPPPPTIYLSPSAQIFSVNSTFTVAVRENSGTNPVNAVQANFSYPAALVDFVSIDTTGTAFTTVAQGTGAAGQVTIAHGLIGTVTGDQLIATVTFRTKTVGGAVAMAFTNGTALASATTNTDILGGLSATGGASLNVDTTPPTVAITTPLNGATISSGSALPITVSATDSSQVSGVDIIVDGGIKATLVTSPYTFNLAASAVTLGTHTIQARAYDPYGNIGTSTITTITVADRTAPTVAITSPTVGTKIIGTANITATSTDNAGGTGVNKVEFYVDGSLKSTSTTAPYSYSWDSKTILDGSHTLSAKAYDNALPANVATSTSIAITVDNADHQAPTPPGSFTMVSNTLNSIVLSWTASSDNIAVTNYRLLRNGVTVTTLNALTYTDAGLTAGTTYNYSIAALDAAGNISAATALTTATKAVKPGDLNNDNLVNILDLSILLNRWNTTDATSDLNHNGTVDIYDLSILLSHFGQ